MFNLYQTNHYEGDPPFSRRHYSIEFPGDQIFIFESFDELLIGCNDLLISKDEIVFAIKEMDRTGHPRANFGINGDFICTFER